MKDTFQWHMLGSIYTINGVSQNPQIFFKIITPNIIYLNAGTKMHEEIGALNVLPHIPHILSSDNRSQVHVILSKTIIFKKKILS